VKYSIDVENEKVADRGMTVAITKPCARCVIPTVNPISAKYDKAFEPIKTLRTYRAKGDEVYVGQNFIHEQCGEINEGDLVQVLEKKAGISFTSDGASEMGTKDVFKRLYHAKWGR
jgi:uncharacterized protein YcbX